MIARLYEKSPLVFWAALFGLVLCAYAYGWQPLSGAMEDWRRESRRLAGLNQAMAEKIGQEEARLRQLGREAARLRAEVTADGPEEFELLGKELGRNLDAMAEEAGVSFENLAPQEPRRAEQGVFIGVKAEGQTRWAGLMALVARLDSPAAGVRLKSLKLDSREDDLLRYVLVVEQYFLLEP